ncbi:O-antigen ligase family protein [Mechercharimyces sp. CAU 1602]|uniref:O-antigen ligase family protein n=1 Tax=Mechercharimyces sp. CAU 1602 TaxID=2973933 RepID=UPI0021610CFD|nr:O-antigen ligase family protein [Mechercharimyces sp. CAU 1602]MCS1352250.1 O-antigen ligase family protein [Mechercharimyces sp. CAU 1602]
MKTRLGTGLRNPYGEYLFICVVIAALLGPVIGIEIPLSGEQTMVITLFRLSLFGLILLLVWEGWQRNINSNLSLLSSYGFIFLVWLGYAVLSLLWSRDIVAGVRYVLYLSMMMGYAWLFPLLLRSEKSVRAMVRVIAMTVTVILSFAFIESITYFHLPTSRYWKIEGIPFITSVFTNQNDLATFITLLIPFILTSFYLLPLGWRGKAWAYLLLVLSLYCLIGTGSRINNLIVFPLVVAVWLISLPFTVKKSVLGDWKMWRNAGVIAASVLIVTGLSCHLLLPDFVKTKIGTTFGLYEDLKPQAWEMPAQAEEMIAGGGDRSVETRKMLILNGVFFLKESAGVGVGAGNVEPYMSKMNNVNEKSNMHNWWMEILVNFGVFIFLLYLLFYFHFLLSLYRRAGKRAQTSSWLRWGLLSSALSLTGFLLGGMAPSTVIHFTPMWTVIGLGLAMLLLYRRGDKDVIVGSE